MKEIPKICGFNECSEAGVDVFAPAIFLNGCNFKCPYCMNSKLAMGQSKKSLDIETIKQYVLDEESKWFMISGGEPTCVNVEELTNLLEEIRSWGCKIGMSTNGSKPEVLGQILPLLNYVAMDFKAVREDDLKELGSVDGVMSVLKSKCLIVENKDERDDFGFEIRTTLYPKYIDVQAIHEIGALLRKKDTWVLQQFRHAKNMLELDAYQTAPYTEHEVEELMKIAKEYSDNVTLRHV